MKYLKKYFYDFIYTLERERESTCVPELALQAHVEAEGEGEADSQLNREPHKELDPKVLGS